jgi:hypothetical protein
MVSFSSRTRPASIDRTAVETFGSHGSNELSFEVNRFDCGFDEAGSLKCGADGLRAMSQLQPAGACLEQERREHEEVLAAHESDLDICAPPQDPLEVSHGRHAAESAAEDDNAHVPSRMACNSITSESDH